MIEPPRCLPTKQERAGFKAIDSLADINQQMRTLINKVTCYGFLCVAYIKSYLLVVDV